MVVQKRQIIETQIRLMVDGVARWPARQTRAQIDDMKGLGQLREQPVQQIGGKPICGRPPPRKVFCSVLIRSLSCVHMSGLSMRSHMNAGQDGFRDTGSKQQGDL
jgi:hypothetical protein